MIVCVCVNVFYGEGRTKDLDVPALRISQTDDIDGGLYGHAVVVHGKNDNAEYMIADPWKEPGFYTVNVDKLIGAMYAAQIDTDTDVRIKTKIRSRPRASLAEPSLVLG